MEKRDTQSAELKLIQEIGSTCVLMRTRLISRVITAIHDDALRPFGIGAAQFVLLVVIGKLEPASRAEIGRYHRQDRSTLSRNLKVILAEGWAEEDTTRVQGRIRPLALTDAGRTLLIRAAPVWRKAQTEAKAVLGKCGANAVMAIANGILSNPAGA